MFKMIIIDEEKNNLEESDKLSALISKAEELECKLLPTSYDAFILIVLKKDDTLCIIFQGDIPQTTNIHIIAVELYDMYIFRTKQTEKLYRKIRVKDNTLYIDENSVLLRLSSRVTEARLNTEVFDFEVLEENVPYTKAMEDFEKIAEKRFIENEKMEKRQAEKARDGEEEGKQSYTAEACNKNTSVLPTGYTYGMS